MSSFSFFKSKFCTTEFEDWNNFCKLLYQHVFHRLYSNAQKLMAALMNSDEEATRMALIRDGADANTTSPTGSRPLHVAALKSPPSLINMLVQHRAKVDQADKQGFTPLMVAALNGRTDAVKALLWNGAEPNLTRLNTGETALHMAINGRSPGVVKALIAGGANINAKTKGGNTPSTYAVKFHASYLEGLLKTYQNCNAEPSEGNIFSNLLPNRWRTKVGVTCFVNY